jgi:hypothetical protein
VDKSPANPFPINPFPKIHPRLDTLPYPCPAPFAGTPVMTVGVREGDGASAWSP